MRTLLVRHAVGIGFAIACVSGSLHAADAPPRRLPATAVLRFAATSTLHDFGGALAARPFTLVLAGNTWSASADALAGQMDTANEKRDRKMHQMFATNAFPLLRGGVQQAPVPGPAGTNVTLELVIRDRTNRHPVQITGWTEDAREIRFHASWFVSLDQYSLKPPSVLGVIRVGDRVQLEADVTATKPVIHP